MALTVVSELGPLEVREFVAPPSEFVNSTNATWSGVFWRKVSHMQLIPWYAECVRRLIVSIGLLPAARWSRT